MTESRVDVSSAISHGELAGQQALSSQPPRPPWWRRRLALISMACGLFIVAALLYLGNYAVGITRQVDQERTARVDQQQQFLRREHRPVLVTLPDGRGEAVYRCQLQPLHKGDRLPTLACAPVLPTR